MENALELRPLSHLLKLFGVEDVTALEGKSILPGKLPEIAFPTEAEVVKSNDFMASFDERVAYMASDEASSAGHKDFHKTSIR
jgi:hypothetical protein